MSFVAGDAGAWLVDLLAGAARKRLATWVLGSEQERALRQASNAAILAVSRELHPDDSERAGQVAMVVGHVTSAPTPGMPWAGTLLETLQAGIAGQLAVLDDASLTGTGRSSADLLGLSVRTLADRLTRHLVQEIIVGGSRGGPLAPLADQLNHDMTHLQGQRIEVQVGEIREAVAELGVTQTALVSALLAQRAQAGLPLPSASEVRCSLPPVAAAFTGRDEELARILALTADNAGADGMAVQVIAGMPGVGKTALVVHAAQALRDRFPDRQLFIDLHGHTPGQDPVAPETALARLLAAVGIDPRSLPADLEGRAGLWRDRIAGQRALLVLDNAASSRQVAPLLPGGDCCQVLVTSRRHLGDLPGMVIPLRVETLPSHQAQAMFVRLAPRAAAEPTMELTELTGLAGFLPLAIWLLARVYVRHPSWTLADLAAETRTSMLTLTAEASTVSGAFDVSYRDLQPSQREFLRLLVLHPGPVIDDYAAAALAGTSVHVAASQLDFLYGEGLLTEVSRHRYGMHDLIRRYAQDRAAADPATDRSRALERLLNYYQRTAALAETRLAQQTQTARDPARTTPPATVPDLPDRKAALAWARGERASLLAWLEHVTRTGQHARVLALTAAMADLLRNDGPWSDALTLHATALQAARDLHDQPGEASALNNLGIMRRLTGDYPGAAQALEKAADLYRHLGDRLGHANTLHNLGDVRRLTGDYLAAAEVDQEALGIYRDLGDRLGQANALSHLAAIKQMTGNYPAAAQNQEEALAIYASLPDRLAIPVGALNNLAAVRRLTGDYPRAAQALDEALSIARDLDDRLGQAHALSNLGAVRRLTGDYPGATKAQQEALILYSDLGDRLGQANTLNEMANLDWRTGDYTNASQAAGQALSIAAELRDRDLRANALISLGVTQRLTGDYPGADQTLQETLIIYADLGNRDGQAETLNELGTLHRLRGDLDQARACHQRAQNLATEITSTWNIAYALAGLGRCALAAGHTADAETNLREAWEIYRRTGIAEASEVATELDKLRQTEPGSPSRDDT